MTSIPLRAVTSARNDADGLVPRTPHSRSGRFDEVDLGVSTGTRGDIDGDDLSDSDPLLKGDDNAEDLLDSPLHAAKGLTDRARFSIIGLTVALFLVFLAGVAYRGSGEEEPVSNHGPEAQTEHSNVTLISYENYTQFPLTPMQYRAECRKVMGEMKHMEYWTDMKMDVSHPSSAPDVCKSTITYLLGSEVGLMADLALLAQVAALAESVSLWILSSLEIGSRELIVNSNNGRSSSMIRSGTVASECPMLSIYVFGSLEYLLL